MAKPKSEQPELPGMPDQPVFDVVAWWGQTADQDCDAFAPKFKEYGSEDLMEIGRTMASIAGIEVTDEEATEIGIYFYLVGKVARWTEALKSRTRPSDDTLLDISTYAMMARMNRAGGMRK